MGRGAGELVGNGLESVESHCVVGRQLLRLAQLKGRKLGYLYMCRKAKERICSQPVL